MAELDAKLQILAQALRDEAALNRIAFYVRQIIEERTLAGRFLNPGARLQYSEAYEEKRALRGLPVNKVDLQFSGAMWGSFDHAIDLDRLEIELGFNREELARIASYHDLHGAGRNKVIREFLGLTDPEMEEVRNFILQEFGEKIDFILNKNLPGYE